MTWAKQASKEERGKKNNNNNNPLHCITTMHGTKGEHSTASGSQKPFPHSSERDEIRQAWT
jgi:hypothetical protein